MVLGCFMPLFFECGQLYKYDGCHFHDSKILPVLESCVYSGKGGDLGLSVCGNRRASKT